MEYQSPQALEELQAFVAVVEANGFTAAARSTKSRKATLSRRVQNLEERLGVSLLVRTTRSLRLTDEGRAYFDHAARALSAVRDAESLVLSSKAEPRGTLRVTTHHSMASQLIDRVLPEYAAANPRVKIELQISAHRPDLVREGIDVAVWAGVLLDSNLMTRRLGTLRGGYYAHPDYLAKRPKLRTPDQLAQHDLIAEPKNHTPFRWRFVVDGKDKYVAITPRLVVTDNTHAVRAAARGLGIALTSDMMAAPWLATNQLVQVLKGFTPTGYEAWAVFPPGGALVPRTRAFLDALTARFASTHGTKRS